MPKREVILRISASGSALEALRRAGLRAQVAFGPEAQQRRELSRPIYRRSPTSEALVSGFVNGEVVGQSCIRDGLVVSPFLARMIDDAGA